MKQIYNRILKTFWRKPMTRPVGKNKIDFINFEFILSLFLNRK
jgi:hypothetical protein